MKTQCKVVFCLQKNFFAGFVKIPGNSRGNYTSVRFPGIPGKQLSVTDKIIPPLTNLSCECKQHQTVSKATDTTVQVGRHWPGALHWI